MADCFEASEVEGYRADVQLGEHPMHPGRLWLSIETVHGEPGTGPPPGRQLNLYGSRAWLMDIGRRIMAACEAHLNSALYDEVLGEVDAAGNPVAQSRNQEVE